MRGVLGRGSFEGRLEGRLGIGLKVYCPRVTPTIIRGGLVIVWKVMQLSVVVRVCCEWLGLD